MCINLFLYFSALKEDLVWGPVSTGPDKFLHGLKLARFHLAFTRDRRNCTNAWTAKATYTRVHTNFCTDKNLHGSTSHLHGTGETGRIFERLSVEVWDLKKAGPKLAHLGPVYTGPNKFLHGQNLARVPRCVYMVPEELDGFWTAQCASLGPAFFRSQLSHLGPVCTGPDKFLHVQKLARFHLAFTRTGGTGRTFERLSVQVWDLLFSGPKLAHLTVQIFVQFRRSRVNARWNRASFCPCKHLSGPV